MNRDGLVNRLEYCLVYPDFVLLARTLDSAIRDYLSAPMLELLTYELYTCKDDVLRICVECISVLHLISDPAVRRDVLTSVSATACAIMEIHVPNRKVGSPASVNPYWLRMCDTILAQCDKLDIFSSYMLSDWDSVRFIVRACQLSGPVYDPAVTELLVRAVAELTQRSSQYLLNSSNFRSIVAGLLDVLASPHCQGRHTRLLVDLIVKKTVPLSATTCPNILDKALYIPKYIEAKTSALCSGTLSDVASTVSSLPALADAVRVLSVCFLGASPQRTSVVLTGLSVVKDPLAVGLLLSFLDTRSVTDIRPDVMDMIPTMFRAWRPDLELIAERTDPFCRVLAGVLVQFCSSHTNAVRGILGQLPSIAEPDLFMMVIHHICCDTHGRIPRSIEECLVTALGAIDLVSLTTKRPIFAPSITTILSCATMPWPDGPRSNIIFYPSISTSLEAVVESFLSEASTDDVSQLIEGIFLLETGDTTVTRNQRAVINRIASHEGFIGKLVRLSHDGDVSMNRVVSKMVSSVSEYTICSRILRPIISFHLLSPADLLVLVAKSGSPPWWRAVVCTGVLTEFIQAQQVETVDAFMTANQPLVELLSFQQKLDVVTAFHGRYLHSRMCSRSELRCSL